jgi:beta-lactam-binding protein with PASTA domain
VSIPPPPDAAETSVVPPPGPPDREPEPSRGLGWGMLLGALVLVAVAAAGAAIYFATRGDGSSATAATTSTVAQTTTRAQTAILPSGKVFVPDVTGLKQDEAATRLGQAHLVPVIQFRPTKKPTGVVVSQDPKAAKRVAKGTNVTVVVDKGVPNVAVPDVAGMKLAAANAALRNAGFDSQTTPVTVAGKPAGTIASQAPAAGQKVAKGTLVTLSVVKAAPKPAATTAATQTTTAPPTTTAPATTTAPQTTTQASQPASATVPDVGGDDVQSASHAIVDAGLLVTLQYVPGTDPLGDVVAQNPAAGATASPRSHVTVNASAGPGKSPQEQVPDVSGQQLKQAVSTLNGAGLRLIFVKVPVKSRAQVGTVVEQTPAAGATAPKNAQVLVYLGVLR